MGTYTVHVVGESFANRQDQIELCRRGEDVILKREPDNPHDELAVKVLSSTGVDIGYIGADQNPWISRIIDDEKAISASIKKITGGSSSKPTRGVILKVLTGAEAKEPRDKYVKIGSFKDIDLDDEKEGGCLPYLALTVVAAIILWWWLS